ncbi:variant surface glycoprotein 3275 [Trypanosoma conorhini]|uniref:Variant surface glycoprotein 3275 n=1 Tax=Trypanosoma conorhini TaxID=83891 RepID=A0A422PM58_9TRYP|nr:variant surface glycoprotein 3275 [Trypanosoma conorhini]RNF18810.1 variant surface glycoprotein 3275 [Trypanosoma conorhini]
MAVRFPTLEERATLVGFATRLAGCSAEDAELLGATCASLIADVDVVQAFIFTSAPFEPRETRGPQPRPDAPLPPTNYCRGGIPLVLTSLSDDAPPRCALFSDTQELFRTQEPLLRALQLRLRRGKATLTSLNAKYNYAFTVVTVGKRGTEANGQGGRILTGTSVGVQSTPATEQAPGDAGDTVPAANRGAEECGREGRRVYVAFMLFLQTLDALLAWVSSLLGILDGEGAVPAVGTYVVRDPAEKETATDWGGSHTSGEQRGKADDTAGGVSAAQSCDAAPAKESSQGGAKGTAAASSSSAVEHASATATRRPRRVRVTRYELHDVNSSFQLFQCQASLFFLPEYTSYDPRLQRRLLVPEYYRALRETVRDISEEIERLQQIGTALTKERPNGVIITFCPAICNFCFIRDTLKLYWSGCVVEDDITSLHYHRMQYNKCVLEVAEVMGVLRQLPRPPARDAAGGRARGSNTTTSAASRSGAPAASVEWVLAPEERGALEAGFASFWSVRGRVLELSDSLTRDIQAKNRTHRYQMPAPPLPSSAAAANGAGTGDGFAQWVRSTVRSWKRLVTCGVELPEGSSSSGRGNGGFCRSTHSPQYESKVELQRLVQRLVKAVEAQATILERDFPGTFYRDAKAKWAQRAGGVVRYLESVSVVFSPPA